MTADETGRLEHAPKILTEDETKRFLDGLPLRKNPSKTETAPAQQ